MIRYHSNDHKANRPMRTWNRGSSARLPKTPSLIHLITWSEERGDPQCSRTEWPWTTVAFSDFTNDDLLADRHTRVTTPWCLTTWQLCNESSISTNYYKGKDKLNSYSTPKVPHMSPQRRCRHRQPDRAGVQHSLQAISPRSRTDFGL